MEQNLNLTLLTTATDPQDVRVIQWEDFEHDLARLSSLSSALNEAKDKKRNLQRKLESLIQVNGESLGRLNELEEMRQKLESKKSMMDNMSIRSRLAKEDAGKQEEQLSGALQSLLVAGGTLSVTRKNLQESSRLLSEENGYVRLRNLQKMLRMRQQYMTSQILMLYPVKLVVGPAQEQELEAYPLGRSADKKEIQKSATALGYVAHAVSLIASYLQVPLRYPVRLGASHSYIIDNAPSIELTSSEASTSAKSFTNAKHVEFPLFLEGQDTTRATYAVFLLSKDLEQLLNFIGAKSLGPRHLLANLRELCRTIQSSDFLDNLI
ncbi:vacuolar protein sorting 38 isoform X2 [Vicia villosa]|uniref:vacuolar protein sorting 38 isoform X2 n=1 Tax=Vicia villosa TaxID=3911 RepID=UPI00273CCF32|nr:vacuolar protein sorting 38 isoform X2 [Vicia villosa]